MKYGWTLTTIAAAATAITLTFFNTAAGDDDRYEQDEHYRAMDWHRLKADVAPATMNKTYRQECGSCHLAYPPGLLPARSWETLLSGLDNHFGDNAELMPATHDEILAYLKANAGEASGSRTAAKIGRTIAPNETPLRITRTRYFVAKHDEIPKRMVEKNPKVGSFSNCAACHRGAEKGYFNEHDVRIPGYGWVD